MFDVGFSELVLIMVVALLVVGPERLPKLARTIGLWMGKLRGFVHGIKTDIDRELAAEELKRILAEQAKVPELESLVEETRTSMLPESGPAKPSGTDTGSGGKHGQA